MGDVASSIGLQAVVGAIARTGDADFDLRRTLQALAEIAQAFTGATGVTIESAKNNSPDTTIAAVGTVTGAPRRLPITAEGLQVGFIVLYGAGMFGPATADRTQVLADLAGLAMAR